MDNIAAVIEAYGLKDPDMKIGKYGSGHIHGTFLVNAGPNRFILQAFNDTVFRSPEKISANLDIIAAHLEGKKLPFVLPLPLKNNMGAVFTVADGQFYRLLPFVVGVTKDAVEHPDQANLAAEAFGRFIQVFLDVPVGGLQESIPDFHNLLHRYQQLQESTTNTKLPIHGELESLVNFYLNQTGLLEQYRTYQNNLPLRVTHSDTKINNLIFKEDLSKVNALIDLDTIMPGYIFYDFGDLVRTVACTEDESSRNWEGIGIDLKKYQALLTGFCRPLTSSISHEEMESLPFGGEMMTYIMGLRFLTDYLNGNVYYTIHYPEQNFHRAKNQYKLLVSLQKNRDNIREMMGQVLAI